MYSGIKVFHDGFNAHHQIIRPIKLQHPELPPGPCTLVPPAVRQVSPSPAPTLPAHSGASCLATLSIKPAGRPRTTAPANAAALRLVRPSASLPSVLAALAVLTGTPAATMSATKLNPFAAPFPCPYPLAPPAPPPFPLADACPPRFPFVTYCCVASPQGHLGLGFCFPVQQCSSPPALALT